MRAPCQMRSALQSAGPQASDPGAESIAQRSMTAGDTNAPTARAIVPTTAASAAAIFWRTSVDVTRLPTMSGLVVRYTIPTARVSRRGDGKLLASRYAELPRLWFGLSLSESRATRQKAETIIDWRFVPGIAPLAADTRGLFSR